MRRRAPLARRQQQGGEGVGRGRVEVFGRLVEDEDGEIGQESPGHRDPLALTAREPGSALAHPGGQAAGETVQPGLQPNGASASCSSTSEASRRPMRKFSARRGAEDVGALLHQPDHPAHLIGRDVHRDTIDVASPRRGRKRTNTSATVDLPAPLGPTSATRRPGLRSRSMPRRTDRSVPG